MNKFCTGCGEPLKEGAKFCTMCGKKVVAQRAGKGERTQGVPVSVEGASIKARERDIKGEAPPMGEAFSSKAKNILGKAKAQVKAKTESAIKTVAKTEAKTAVKTTARTIAKDVLSGNSPALATVGESVLPVTLAAGDAGNVLSLLKDGLTGLLKGAKQILKDKKRLTLVGVLAGVWFLVNILSALGISPLPVRFLSWLTFAQGGLVGGSVGKGILAAFFTRFITGGNMLSPLKGILGQLQGIARKDKDDLPVFLLGTGAALIAANMLISSTLQNTMVPIAAFMLGAAAIRRNSFLHRLTTALLPRVKVGAVTIAMQGWALGFLAFTALCILPGGNNGYLAGVLSLGTAVGLQFLKKDKKEVPAR